ncbi:MAG TPA: aminotransferase class III-fold pyridoxal phosphate-dependent enzyme, partial [Ktedonobacterales bacterium]
MEPGSPVYAPLDGVVHSLQNNAAPRDYGPTIILRHTVDAGRLTFYTLYGHLSLDSLDGLREGMVVTRGTEIARIGDEQVNGGWPPHVHFQLIADLLDKRGDFPGVARPSQRAVWLSLSPDPNVILGLPAKRPAVETPSNAALLTARRAHIGPNLSVSYRQPLQIARGFMQYLYDTDGRRYLDAVNNVPHVGHSHPRVVQAGQRQMAVLNTNTRYLHPDLITYAERLTALLPEPLRVCYLVCSGSEANELALRLARAHTRRRAIIAVDVAYHGNTSTLVDISAYKHAGPGGAGAPPWVHVVPLPDPYRGPYRDPATAGEAYAAHAGDALRAASASASDTGNNTGAGAAAFICESMLGCGGQLVLPDGYLRAAYQQVRAAGGVCVADEVQTGFGRVGSHFWAFETQGVVPDIVTLGKPIGNGHPLGAVVTTPEIAASFDNGMEYFNTFGGNPVSCAIGLAVLDVLRDDGLQAHALQVGNHLLAGLRALMDRHPLIGEVRGLGLFIGVDLVLDRATRAPAPAQAAYIANRMRERGVLLSTDGPHHNVLKIKPPLVFDASDADFLVATLDTVLAENAAQPILEAANE